MITNQHISYLIHDVVCNEDSEKPTISATFTTTHFTIKWQGTEYSELLFDFEKPELTNADFEILDDISSHIYQIKNNPAKLFNLYTQLDFSDVAYLKIIHFFINEHYLKHPTPIDAHGRVFSQSIEHRYTKYMQFPVVDVLIDAFRFRFFNKNKKQSTIYFTCDYDYINLWKYLGFTKSVWRLIRHIFFFRRELLVYEIWTMVYSNKRVAYNMLLSNRMYYKQEIRKYAPFQIRNLGFLLVDCSHKKFDFTNDYTCNAFKQYLNENIGVEFGIHSSYNTTKNAKSMQTQIESFERIIYERPRFSRFHYLRCNYPDDLSILADQGIKTDFSFCFSDSLMYRAATTHAFKQWSYQHSKPVGVSIIPLSIMDVMLKNTLKYSYDEALSKSKEKIELSSFLGSNCVLLWHNNSLYPDFERKNYHPKLLLELKKHIATLAEIDI